MADQAVSGFLRRIEDGEVLGPLVVVGADGAPIDTSDLSALAERYGGDLIPATGVATTSGSHVLISPAAGKRLKVYWVAFTNDPDASSTPLVLVKFDGGLELYRQYATAHWEIFTGVADQDLVMELDQSGSVAWTVHYKEID